MNFGYIPDNFFSKFCKNDLLIFAYGAIFSSLSGEGASVDVFDIPAQTKHGEI